MNALLQTLLDPAVLSPHGFCLAWDPRLLWLHAGANAAVAAAYFSIPIALLRFVRARQDLAFPWVFWLFAAFILACGTTHLMGVVTLWLPLYWLDGAVMAITAVVSLVTAAALWPLLPRALALPSPQQFRIANEALVREIAERDRLTAKLAESEALLRAQFDHATDLLAVLHADAGGAATFEAANPALAELLGRSADSVAGLEPEQVMEGEAGAKLSTTLALSLRTAMPQRFETRLATAQGEERVFEAIVVPVPGMAGGATRIVASLRDITERVQLEQRLAQGQKMEALGRMTGGIAHDFNNILMGLSGALQRILQDGALDERRRTLALAAQASVERGARLVRHMLAFARRQPLEPQVIRPNELVQTLADDVIAAALGSDVRIETDLDPDAWSVVADRSQFDAALLNLAVNARDAMPHGGRLTLRTRNVELDAAAADGELEAGPHLRIEVADTGTGMEPEVSARAFEPFFTTKPLGVGTGLGLSQVYGFARQSGGRVQLRSQPGRGTTVVIDLPRFEPRTEEGA